MQQAAHYPSTRTSQHGSPADRVCGSATPVSGVQLPKQRAIVVPLDEVSAAKALSFAPSQLRHHVHLGDITPRFSGPKPIYPLSELQRFVQRLPTRPAPLPGP